MVLDASNFIAAIKTVRTLAQGDFAVEMVGGQMVIKSKNGTVGLKDAKDFVEDIMALGVRRFLDDQKSEWVRSRARIAEYRRQQAVAADPYPDDIEF